MTQLVAVTAVMFCSSDLSSGLFTTYTCAIDHGKTKSLCYHQTHSKLSAEFTEGAVIDHRGIEVEQTTSL